MFLLVLVMLAIPSIAQAEDSLEREYLLTPKSIEWSKYNAYELQEKLNISRDKVTSLNTNDLLELVLKYPFIGDVYAFNTVEDGIETIRKRFEPLDELLQRGDISEVIYHRYLDEKDIGTIKKEIMDGNYENSLKINFLEFLLEKQEVYSQLNDSQINEIVKKAIDIESELDIDSKFRQQDSVFKDDFDKEISAKSWGVYTPKGSYVEVYIKGEELSEYSKNQINYYFDTTYPKATRLRGATTNYNCHSYAWYSTSSSNKYWMDDPSPYKTDGSYRNVGFLPTSPGQKLYYPVLGGHTAIVNKTSSSIWGVNMTSKWGKAGLYKHTYGNDPYSIGAPNLSNWQRN
ncbi:MAG: hypothetical protein Q4A00_08525 [Flavobacteriaceae bacterium]|nr:hypothetical protein [Flavobacteriaceae bacterium]